MIELRSADKAYWTLHGVVTALTDIDIAAPGGRVLAVTGGAGSGKSTLLRLLALQEAPMQAKFVCSVGRWTWPTPPDWKPFAPSTGSRRWKMRMPPPAWP